MKTVRFYSLKFSKVSYHEYLVKIPSNSLSNDKMDVIELFLAVAITKQSTKLKGTLLVVYFPKISHAFEIRSLVIIIGKAQAVFFS